MASHRFVLSILTVILIGYVYSQSNDLDVDDIEKKIQELPGLEQFNSSKLPTEEDLEKLLKEKCEKNGGGEEAYQALKNQQALLQSCIEQHVNATQIQIEIEEAKKTGSMDDVLGKYCRKYPEVFKCFETVTDKIKSCLNAGEQDAMDKALNITGELKEFLCYKDGDRIAMFIAEGGLECLDSRKDALQECANKTIGSRIPTDLSIDTMPTFLFSDRDCNDFDTLRQCSVSELEKCKDTTPANIVDAFFKFLKKHSPCKDVVSSVAKEVVQKPSSANVSTISSLLLLATLISQFY